MDQLRQFGQAFRELGLLLLGIALVEVVLTAWRARRLGWRAAVSRSIPEACAASSLSAIVTLTVLPLVNYGAFAPPAPRPPQLVPLLPLVWELGSGDAAWAVVSVVANLVLYAPLGLGLAWRLGLRLRWVVLAALLVSVSAETVQALTPDRSSDVNDVLLNVLGALLGGVAGLALWRRAGPG